MKLTLTKNRLGFSLKGLIILLLVLLPNLLFYAFAVNGTAGTGAVFGNRVEIISYIERLSQILLMLVLIFRVNKSSPSLQSRYVFGMAVFLLLYYALWIRYFAGGMDYTLISGTFSYSWGCPSSRRCISH